MCGGHQSLRSLVFASDPNSISPDILIRTPLKEGTQANLE